MITKVARVPRRRFALALAVPVVLALAAPTLAATSRSSATGKPAGVAAAQPKPRAAVKGPIATVSPIPGTKYAESTTEISFQGVPSKDVKDLLVKGSLSGKHAGRVVAYSNGKGASFLPAKRFVQGETVTVTAPFTIFGGKGDHYSFKVAIGGPAQPRPAAGRPDRGQRRELRLGTDAAPGRQNARDEQRPHRRRPLPDPERHQGP